MNLIARSWLILLLNFGLYGLSAQTISTVGNGWAGNSVNAVVFRKNSIASWQGRQYIAYYDQDKNVILGTRKLGDSTWKIKKTQYQGNVADAHCSISLIVDGEGYLHISWNHHGSALNYARSLAPGSLLLGDRLPMTGISENNVTYPEFYTLAGGNLLFVYRDGSSGNGNMMLNRYNLTSKQWTQVQHGLIDGEGKRNAYWQMAVDGSGFIHLSWVWRESPDVASNHDLCYALSRDGGRTWEKSTGQHYQLPITMASAEVAAHIPQHSELINQTSMVADAEGNPFIATYWRDSLQTVPQYHLVYRTGKTWKTMNLGFRKTAFSLSGAGTKSVPLSRPQILVWQHNHQRAAALIFRDRERGAKISVAYNLNLEAAKGHKAGAWQLKDLTSGSVGDWEPSYDTELWKNKRILNLYVQQVFQVDAEGKAAAKPTPVQVLSYPLRYICRK